MHSDYTVVLLGGIKVNLKGIKEIKLWPEPGNPGRNKTVLHEIKAWVSIFREKVSILLLAKFRLISHFSLIFLFCNVWLIFT